MTILRRYPSFVILWFVRLTATMAYHMLAVVIGWQIYAITGSAFDLGLVGLLQFIPAVVLTLLVGHLADRYDRQRILAITLSIYVLCAIAMLAGFAFDFLSRELMFAVVFVIGCARSFDLPTGHALVPALVPESVLPRATAAWAASNQTATICGPALGGLTYSVSPVLSCALCVVLFAIGGVCAIFVRTTRPAGRREPPTVASVLAGYHFIRTRPLMFGVITLDLFVVLLGGTTALLPIFARDILHEGPFGLGLLRSAPAIGALLTMLWLTRKPIERHIGATLFAVVAVFGVATIVFALSTSFVLSLIVLAVLGASDAISVVLRFTLVQMATPDAMRGRVSAINSLCANTSNTLGEFESGALAALIGAVPAVLIGGVGSILIAVIWMTAFPDLRRIDRYKTADELAKPT